MIYHMIALKSSATGDKSKTIKSVENILKLVDDIRQATEFEFLCLVRRRFIC